MDLPITSSSLMLYFDLVHASNPFFYPHHFLQVNAAMNPQTLTEMIFLIDILSFMWSRDHGGV